MTLKQLLPAIAAIGLTLCLVAAEAAETKIGFIDIQRLQRESAPAERASKQLEKEFAPRLQELQRRESQIKTLQGQIEKEAMTMSETDRRAKEQELARTTLDFQRMQREYREDLNLRRNQELASLVVVAEEHIADIQRRDGLHVEGTGKQLLHQPLILRTPRT